MEEPTYGSCSVVYFCPAASDGFSEHFDSTNLPATLDGQHSATPRNNVYGNICRLLDQDQGDFDKGKFCGFFWLVFVVTHLSLSIREFVCERVPYQARILRRVKTDRRPS